MIFFCYYVVFEFSLVIIFRFGSDNIDRGELVKIAADRAEKLFPGGFDLRVHVGDTVCFSSISSSISPIKS